MKLRLQNALRTHRRTILLALLGCYAANIILYVFGFEYPGQIGSQLFLMVAAGLLWTMDEKPEVETSR